MDMDLAFVRRPPLFSGQFGRLGELGGHVGLLGANTSVIQPINGFDAVINRHHVRAVAYAGQTRGSLESPMVHAGLGLTVHGANGHRTGTATECGSGFYVGMIEGVRNACLVVVLEGIGRGANEAACRMVRGMHVALCDALSDREGFSRSGIFREGMEDAQEHLYRGMAPMTLSVSMALFQEDGCHIASCGGTTVLTFGTSQTYPAIINVPGTPPDGIQLAETSVSATTFAPTHVDLQGEVLAAAATTSSNVHVGGELYGTPLECGDIVLLGGSAVLSPPRLLSRFIERKDGALPSQMDCTFLTERLSQLVDGGGDISGDLLGKGINFKGDESPLMGGVVMIQADKKIGYSRRGRGDAVQDMIPFTS